VPPTVKARASNTQMNFHALQWPVLNFVNTQDDTGLQNVQSSMETKKMKVNVLVHKTMVMVWKSRRKLPLFVFSLQYCSTREVAEGSVNSIERA
jgi:hypothetical protein